MTTTPSDRTAPSPAPAVSLPAPGEGWESNRLTRARRSTRDLEDALTPLGDEPALAREVAAGRARLLLTFAGQGADWLEDLRALLASPAARELLERGARHLDDAVAALPEHARTVLAPGLAPLAWARPEADAPPLAHQRRAAVSAPALLLTQLARLEALREAGLASALDDGVHTLAGHSQGAVSAVAASAVWSLPTPAARGDALAPYLAFALRLGLRMEQATCPPASPAEVRASEEAGLGTPTTMASISGVLARELELALQGDDDVVVASRNGPQWFTLAGPAGALERVRARFAARAAQHAAAKKKGRAAGRCPAPGWAWLPVSGPFHSRWLEGARDALVSELETLALPTEIALRFDVLDPAGTGALPADGSVFGVLARRVLTDEVRWSCALQRAHDEGVTHVVDVGPGDAGAALAGVALYGRGVPVVASGTESGERALLARDVAPRARQASFASYRPSLRRGPDGRVYAHNRFVERTGAPCALLPGMTPTTVEAPIVVAAANAGFVAELAGGGQVTESILRARLDEIVATLEPGRGIVFNALYLDPYLWGLHFAKEGLVFRLKDEGYPIIGVTVSAGVPDEDEAHALLKKLRAHGIWLNALKPGNDRELAQVLRIADAEPAPLWLHLEGGKAGGHHSWEALDDLLLRHYGAIRRRDNVVLCVGGGIAREAQAAAYLDGTWASAFDHPEMPVDAIFLGTRLMATREACTAPGVKAALADARGEEHAWPLDGDVEGGVTSGRSQLDASIYYLDNAAARAGRLLDEVAGDAEKVAARRDEIIAALAGTAKPYFGDVERMTWNELLQGLAERLATGRGTAYDDGAWGDVTWRARFEAMVRVAEARLVDGESASVLDDDDGARDPFALLSRFAARYPRADEDRVHPEDARRFLEVCRRPGKPVPFVPVLDADVRRWFKSDSLWQAHDDRLPADGVLTIPGPSGLAGIERTDEPVAEVLDGFALAPVAALEERGVEVDADVHAWADVTAGAPTEAATGALSPTEGEVTDAERWLERLGNLGGGPVAGSLRARNAFVGGRAVPSPLRTLLAVEDGATATWQRERDGTLTRLALFGADGEPRARLALDDGALRARAVLTSGGQERELELGLAWDDLAPAGALRLEREAWLRAQRELMGARVLGADATRDEVALFDEAHEDVRFDADRMRAFRAATHDVGHEPGVGLAFAFAWPAVWRALSATPGDLFRLVHEQHEVEVAAWPPAAGEPLRASARVVRLEDTAGGRRVVTRARVVDTRGREVARTCDHFFIRESFEVAPGRAQARDHRALALEVTSAGDAAFLGQLPWLALQRPLVAGERLDLNVEEHLTREADGPLAVRASGTASVAGEVIGAVDLRAEGEDVSPLDVVDELLGAPSHAATADDARVGAREQRAPTRMDGYASASGDRNPLHTDVAVARLAGFATPIVHGMWTASWALAAGVEIAAEGDPRRVTRARVRFTAPLAPGAAVALEARRTAVLQGAQQLALDVRGDGTPVVDVELEVRPPRSAFVYPGQGTQTPGMGMDGYDRSRAARAVWDEADRTTQERFGFSLLEVVRDNPRELWVRGERVSHPAGVLHLTQFTQVALAVLAVAQTRELEEAGLLPDDARFAGHSLGEYSALAALGGVLPLPAVVAIVYHRGLTMDRLVERDADGRSPFAMGVVRPHRAGLDEAAALAVVDEVARATRLPLEVVNFNGRGRQYAVTGHVNALRALADRLGDGWTPVPGVDVPFHSTLLRDGVCAFRETLDHTLPERVDARRLVDRYLPNLTGTLFRLDDGFLDEMERAVGAAPVAPFRAALAEGRPEDALARDLLIELLAWQFASPVQWIRTQDALFDDHTGVERIVEVGVAGSPTLSNLARSSLRAAGRHAPDVLHAELDRDALRGPEPVAAPEPEPEAAREAETAPAGDVAAPAPAAPAPAPAAPASTAPLVDDADLHRSGLVTLLATLLRVPATEVDLGRSLDDLLGGNSARRNQVLADLAAEMGVRAMDGAHELALCDLLTSLREKAPAYDGWGSVLRAAADQALAKALAAAGLDRQAADRHLESQLALPASHRTATLHRATLVARQDGPTFADRGAAHAWLDEQAHAYAAEHGLSIAAPAAATGGATVDAGALAEVEAAVSEQLAAAGRALAEATGVALDRGQQLPAPAASEAPVLGDEEHGDGYEELIAPRFDAKKHVGLTSAWAWSRRDLLEVHDGLLLGEPALDDALLALGARLEVGGRAAARALAARANDPAIRDAMLRVADAPPAAADLAGTTALVTGAGPGSIALSVVERLLARGARVVVTTSSYRPARVRMFKQAYQQHAVPGAELHVVPCNQGNFQDVDALVRWLGEPVKERVGSSERLVRAPLVPDLLLPFGAVPETADLRGLGARSLATLRVLLLGVERLIARLSEQDRRGGRRLHVVLPLSPNHGDFGGDGAYGESKAALEAVLHRWRAERDSWGARTTLVGARIGWVRGTGLMHQNDDIAPRLEEHGVTTFSSDEMADLLVAQCADDVRARAEEAPVEADLTGGLGGVTGLGELLREAHADRAAELSRQRRLDELCARYDDALGRATVREPVRPRARPEVAPPLPTDDELSDLPALDHLDLDRVVVVCGYGEVGPFGSARTRWALERQGTLSLEAVLELAWTMGLVRPSEDDAGFVDAESGEPVEDADLHERYEEHVLAHVGVREHEPDQMGFDPAALVRLVDVHLDRDFTFPVPSRELAESLRLAAPDHTEVTERDGRLFVTRRRGAVLRMPSAMQWQRHVAGQLPAGWDARRLGVPDELVDQVDPVTLYCLVATAEAFLAAGLEPDDVHEYLHPSRVGITLGTGIGGMKKLHRLHRDFFEDAERQNDTLQETLINVIGGWVVQSYLGSYGPMSFPVGACATAGVSVADGASLILEDKADLVLAGGADDLSEAGLIGFGDMGATADTRDLAERGVEPHRMSRPSDSRRRGFVEAQGAGTLLLTRASFARDRGLPVYSVVAYAGTSGDGLQRSVPAPGQGALVAATGTSTLDAARLTERRARIAALEERTAELAALLGEDEAARTIARARVELAHDPAKTVPGLSPLASALAVLGLNADDVAVVSKHDSSTQANDENEARLHERLATALGRSPDLPLPVVSQKALTGHPKGAAAAWQLNGLMQAMADGVLPGNPSLDDVSAELAPFSRLIATDRPRRVPRASLRAGLVTTLGFGHISALVCLAHPFLFWRMLNEDERASYGERVKERATDATTRLRRVLSGRAPLFERREPLDLPADEEAARLLDPAARMSRGSAGAAT